MQKNKFSFKVASFRVSDENIIVNIHALETEADYRVARKDFEKWLTNGSNHVETEIAPDVYSKDTIEEYWAFSREVNNTDALHHLHAYLTENVDAVRDWMETEVVIDLFREKMVKNNLTFDYLDESLLRTALTLYRSSYAHHIISHSHAA